MANYSLTNTTGSQQPIAPLFTGSLLGVTAAATPRRIKLYDLLIGTNGVPADNYMEWSVDRVTANSTATVAGAAPLDLADAGAVSICTANSSSFGAVTVNVAYVGVNQRASYRWVCAPGSELVAPAVTGSGFQLRARSGGYTGTATGTFMFREE